MTDNAIMFGIKKIHRGLTVVNESVFGFTAIALGDGFLVPSHTTGGVYIMEATRRFPKNHGFSY